MQQRQLVSVIDDDDSVRESLPDLLDTMGFRAKPFVSAEGFLASDALAVTACLILDVSMPAMSGPQLQSELSRRKIDIPIIFITAQDEPMLRTSLLAAGAVDCLLKPFSAQALRSALSKALPKS
jgi:FixJ family two-component response regulator